MPLTAIDFLIVRKMYSATRPGNKKWLRVGSLCINLGILFYFKDSNFFIENINSLFIKSGLKPIEWISVALPIGISFFCFETLTYSIDAYRGVIKPLNKLTDYYLYILLFPKLIAGPIVRFNLIEDQIQTRNEIIDDRLMGFFRFIIGLSKKVLIANVMGKMADTCFNGNIENLDSIQAWIGILAYTFQIYFDFSGYSDMALGIGRMLGFKFPENFDNPYTSCSITEFWRRWHITLGMWMREYLYIPLGGSHVKTKRRLYFNLWVVFLLSGLWHGASWNFVLWGAYHGLFLIMDKMFLLRFYKFIGKIPSTLITFLIVLFGWVLFRMENFSTATIIYEKLFSFHCNSNSLTGNGEFWAMLTLALLFSFFTVSEIGKKIQNKIYYSQYTIAGYISATFIVIGLFAICIASITASDFNPFIYFRF
ncbi:MAG: MBOAT family protein [Bacteroidia bacterium]|nr:MBOAT family protein [Bacteroidia bacterium]